LQRSGPIRKLGILFSAVVAAGGAFCATGCAPATGNGVHSPEQQSEAQFRLAVEYYKVSNFRLALESARKAVELNDQNKDALLLASSIYMRFCSDPVQPLRGPDCKLSEAEKYARLALKVDDHYRDARNSLAAVLIEERKYDEAITTLDPLVNDPAYEQIHLAFGNLGWAQVLGGRIDKGIESLSKAIALSPRFCVGLYRLGIAYEKKKDLAQAEASLSRALAVTDPGCQALQDAWWARARVRLGQGKHDLARTDLEKCRDLYAESETGKSCVAGLAAMPAPDAPQQ